MIVINKGKKIIEGDVGQLMSSESIKLSIKTTSNKEIENFFNSRDIAYDSNEDIYTISWPEKNIDQLVKELQNDNISIFEIKQLKTLEEYFKPNQLIKLINIELYKVIKKPRTYIGFLAIFLIVDVMQLAMYFEGEELISIAIQNLENDFRLEGKNNQCQFTYLHTLK